jgi:hypothetical protein
MKLIQIEPDGTVVSLQVPDDIADPEQYMRDQAEAIEPLELYEGPWPEGFTQLKMVDGAVVGDEGRQTEDDRVTIEVAREMREIENEREAQRSVPKTLDVTIGNQTKTFFLNERYISLAQNEIYWCELEGRRDASILTADYEILTVPLAIAKTIWGELWREYRKVLARKAQLNAQ